MAFLLRSGSALALAALCIAASPALSQAAAPIATPFWETCKSGSVAGQCTIPRGVAVAPPGAPDASHVFVGDQTNKRVQEFTAWGEFVRTYGWRVNKTKVQEREAEEAASEPVTVTEAEENLCTAVSKDVCQAGTNGNGENAAAGRFGSTQGIAVDSAGDVYVVDRPNHRVQEFDPEGHFLLMFGGEVNKTKVQEREAEEAASEPVTVTEAEEDLCTAASEDECKVGVEDPSHVGHKARFGELVILGSYIAVDTKGTTGATDDVVYVGDKGRIARFDAAGEFQSDLPDPGGLLSGKKVLSLATYPSGELFVALEGSANVFELNPTSGAKQCEAEVTTPLSLAADPDGKLYVAEKAPTPRPNQTIREFDGGSCEEVEDARFPFSQGEAPSNTEGFSASGLAAQEVDGKGGINLYATNSIQQYFLAAYGPQCEPVICGNPPPHAPVITRQYASSVDTEGAVVKAKINPFFWEDTSYHVEYGTGECSKGGCPQETPAPDSQLGGGAVRAPLDTEGVFLGGLLPNTTYHYRFVAKSSGAKETSGAKKPVYGIDPDGEEGAGKASFAEGLEGTFTTFAGPSGAAACPNEALRSGPSAQLPDCRAYELVSPLDKNGGDAQALGLPSTTASRFTSFKESAAPGDGLTWSAATAFGDAPAGPYSSQYLSTRGAGGWSTHGISAPRGTVISEGEPELVPIPWELESQFQAFTPDLSSAWVKDNNVSPLTADALHGYVDLYRRENGSGAYEALSKGSPLGPATQYLNGSGETGSGPGLRFQGHSADLHHQIFSSDAALTADAAPVIPHCSTTSSASTIHYAWLRNGQPIAGATEAEYTPTATDEGKILQCQVSAEEGDWGTTQVAQPPWPVAAPGQALAKGPHPATSVAPPSSSGPLEVAGPGGQALHCESGEWLRAESLAYQWYRNGAPLETSEEKSRGSQTPTYTVSAADLASPAVFQCVVTGANEAGAASQATPSLATEPAPENQQGVTASMGGSAKSQLYDLHEGKLELVSMLPGGEADPNASYAGTLQLGEGTRFSDVQHAISDNGQRIFWTSNASGGDGPGQLYARIGGEETIPVSEEGEAESGTSASRFWDATPSGSKVLFTAGEDLYLFDVNKALAEEAEPTTLIAHEVKGVAGASEELTRIYFGSTKALAEGAVEGRGNLYLREGAKTKLVGVLGTIDLRSAARSENGISPVNSAPIYRASRVSPDGSTLAFQALGSPTGYDNEGPEGKRFTEVYRYSATADGGDGQLRCVSCNPSGAAPSGIGVVQTPYTSIEGRPLGGNEFQANGEYATAAILPTWEHEQYASRLLSEDGSRLFFESYERLVPRDTNGAKDVYEWEAASGQAQCDGIGATLYVASAEGCLSLISTGASPQPSEFLDASADGNDVFISTTASIAPGDEGLIDIYDARVNGGFAQRPEAPECAGDACQPVPSPPEDQTPASANFHGQGNLVPPPQCGARARQARRLSRRARKLRRAARRAGRHRGAVRARNLRRRSGRLARRAKASAKRAHRCRRAARRARR